VGLESHMIEVIVFVGLNEMATPITLAAIV
jgi:hypothetical protein